MNIIYISSSTIPSLTANSIHCMRMCQALAAEGHHVTLLASEGESSTNAFEYYGVDETFELVFLPRPGAGSIFRRVGGLIYAWYVRRFLKLFSRQIHLAYGRSAQGTLIASLLGIPTIYEVHAPPSTFFRKLNERLILRSSSLVRLVAISEALRTRYEEEFPSLVEQVQSIVAHDAADSTQLFGAPLLDWPGRECALQAGYVGHLYRGKGAEIIIDLAKRMPEVDFHLVGGTEKDISRWQSATSLGNLFFHGHIPPYRVGHYHEKFDVLLLPARQHVAAYGNKGDIGAWMSPLKMFEYMASGKPIIASDLSVLREVLQDRVNCLLAKPDSYHDWCQALEIISNDQAFAKQLAMKAKEDWSSHHTWRKRAAKVLDAPLSGHE